MACIGSKAPKGSKQHSNPLKNKQNLLFILILILTLELTDLKILMPKINTSLPKTNTRTFIIGKLILKLLNTILKNSLDSKTFWESFLAMKSQNQNVIGYFNMPAY